MDAESRAAAEHTLVSVSEHAASMAASMARDAAQAALESLEGNPTRRSDHSPTKRTASSRPKPHDRSSSIGDPDPAVRDRYPAARDRHRPRVSRSGIFTELRMLRNQHGADLPSSEDAAASAGRAESEGGGLGVAALIAARSAGGPTPWGCVLPEAEVERLALAAVHRVRPEMRSPLPASTLHTTPHLLTPAPVLTVPR